MNSALTVSSPFSMDLDRATARLVAQLALEDIEDIDSRRKRKARADAPPTDEETAMVEQALIYQALLSAMDDFRFAESLDEALEADQEVLSAAAAAEQAALDDHLYAEALSNGRPPPARSRAQEMAERAARGEEGVRNAAVPVDVPAVLRAGPSSSGTSGKKGVDIVIECIVCMDDIGNQQRVQGPCGHFYCQGCTRALVASAMMDESLWPLRCEGRPLPLTSIRSLLDSKMQRTFDAKAAEFGTPAMRRLYCPNATCSHFLGTTDDAGKEVLCPRCGDPACASCKQRAHPGAACAENRAAAAVRDLATAQGWQTCPECRNIVELSQGCFHMTCRCRAQFCYLCAVPWKGCQCRQWDENRLLETARLRVENELGAGAQQAAPTVFRERVQQRVERLRYNHDCGADGHRWRRRNGGGACESCYHFLDQYLLFCKDCAMMACVRCARNRL